jgi:hypothetical protein
MMKKFHHVTNVTALVILFAVFFVSGVAATTSEIQFQDPAWKFKQASIDTPAIQATKDSVATSNLKLVFEIGKEVGNPETLQAILMQETDGGRSSMIGNVDSPVGKKSYGLMQVQVCAARSVFQRVPSVFEKYFPGRTYKSIVDEEIIALLITNKEANARIAAHHFRIYMAMSGGNWDRAVASYNAGIGTHMVHYDKFVYVVGVKDKMNNIVKPFNKQNGLQLTQRY